MSNLMTRGMDFLQRNLREAGGVDVVVTPFDKLGTISMTNVIVGRSPIDVTQPGQSGTRREHGEREYLPTVAQLMRNGQTVLPALGDLYAETINGVNYVFSVAPGDNKAPWDWCDHQRTQVRVRTKRVS